MSKQGGGGRRSWSLNIESGGAPATFQIAPDGNTIIAVNDPDELPMDEWVHMVGKVPFFEITEYIELADLCLMSFELNDVTKDITPVKIMEYMAMKKPVLSNSLPSVVREIGENNGVIFTRNQNELIKKIGELTGKKESLKKIGLRGFDLIKKHYVWPKILNNLKVIMLNLIKDKKYKK